MDLVTWRWSYLYHGGDDMTMIGIPFMSGSNNSEWKRVDVNFLLDRKTLVSIAYHQRLHSRVIFVAREAWLGSVIVRLLVE